MYSDGPKEPVRLWINWEYDEKNETEKLKGCLKVQNLVSTILEHYFI